MKETMSKQDQTDSQTNLMSLVNKEFIVICHQLIGNLRGTTAVFVTLSHGFHIYAWPIYIVRIHARVSCDRCYID